MKIYLPEKEQYTTENLYTIGIMSQIGNRLSSFADDLLIILKVFIIILVGKNFLMIFLYIM